MSSKHKAFTPRPLASLPPLPANQESLPTLVSQLRGLIEAARGQALRAVDSIQVRACWEIGRHIVEFEQQGADRAMYGARLIPKLAQSLTVEFGKGFDERNLRHMRTFFQDFPIWNAVRTELSWTHYSNLLRVDGEQARHWYMNEAADQNWSTRALDDNPAVGIILCAGKDPSVVRYSVLHENEQLFASKYKLVLPSEDELRAELEKGQLWLAEQ
jgi:hypothetical protein